MIGLADAAKDDLLRLFAGTSHEIGLFSGDDEITDDGYSRLAVAFSEPQGDDTRFVENTTEVRFDAFSREHKIDHWGVFLGGELRARYKLTDPRTLSPEDSAVFRPGSLRVGLI